MEEELKLAQPEDIKKAKLPALDGLRGISILLVIISHILKNFPIGGWYTGQMGVNIFFVISGFLITTLLLKERATNGSISLKNFYIRRGLRILPLIYLYLAVLFFLNIIFNLKVTGASFLAAFFLVKNLPISKDWYTTHFWTIGIEEQFYLVFPFLLTRLPLRVFKRLIIVLIIVLPVISFTYFKKIDVQVLHVSRPAHFALGAVAHVFGRGTVMILIGSLFSILFLTGSVFISRLYAKAAGPVSLILFLAGITFCYPEFPWHVRYISEVFFGIIVAIVIILNLKTQSWFGRLLNGEMLKMIGILSYSLYIWQQLFTYEQPWGSNPFLNTAGLVIVTLLSYYFYEKKFLQYKDLFRKV